ncbi:molecular chaperone DnaJ [Patescibacteria group bacterium]|nr:molecular chaperone DnaJ [Patescibacteria group bacterium]
MAKDFYSILGVSKTASPDEIKKSFRRLAHEHHPDKGGNAERFKDINEAYQVLGDEKKRAAYDRFGSAAFEQGAGGPGGFEGGFPGGFNVNMGDMGDLGDMLSEMFGFGRPSGGGSQKPHGQDIAVDVNLSFKEGIFGLTKEVVLVRPDKCETCHGDGAEPGTKRKTCSTCSGSGQVRQAQRTFFGTVQVMAACSTCVGSGTVPETPCHSCKGNGIVRREVKIHVDIPCGVSDGDTLQMPGQGEAAPHGGISGNLYLRLHIANDRTFTREGQRLHSTVEIPYSTLLLGGSVTVQTIDEEVEISIDARTATGTEIVIAGKGVPSRQKGRRGDHVVHVSTMVPKKLTREQEQALESLRSAGL